MTRSATLRQGLDAAITEKDFMQAVIDLARLNHWLAYHVHDARRSEPGFPDLVLCRAETDRYPGQVMYVECKTAAGRVSAAQIRWLDALKSARVEVHVWRPADWPTIEARLKRKHSLPLKEVVA